LTNLWFVYLGYRGITNHLRNRHDSVFLYAFISYLLIGLGSFAFHATLKYPMQLLDELCMIYTTCILFFAIFSYGRTPATQAVLAGLTTALALFVTVYYHYLGDPVFHQNVFAALTALVFFRSWWKMERTLRPSRRKSLAIANGTSKLSATEQARRDRRDEQILKVMYAMIPVGLISVAAGFGIWNLDNIFCSTLRRWRREVGLPWGILLEGHGWWYVYPASSLAAFSRLSRTAFPLHCEADNSYV
jgi:dihydroceramidase